MIQTEYLWTAFVIGLAGSFHCVGMCGPIALALPANFNYRIHIVFSRILYNLGRVLTYTALGALFGVFGKAIALAGVQQALSIALGVVLLLVAFFSMNLESNFISFPFLTRFNIFIKNNLGKLLKVNSQSSLLMIGVLNGFLPCGFVYLGLVGAITTGTVVNGALYMMLFGLGTFPLMFATSMLGSIISIRVRNVFRKLTPAFFILFACLFIVRGMNLGIPYISPKINSIQSVRCH